MNTASAAGLVSCHGCAALHPRGEPRCARCGAPLHSRKAESLQRATALCVAAALLYIPANTLPIMTVKKLGRGDPNTILSGVQHLIEGGLWSLALLVFFASVLVPVLKLVGLAGLIWSVRRGSQWRPADRTRLYRVVESVGRWSMIDIFMISILVALVQLGTVAQIEPGPGAVAFAAVVVLTMFAASAFDPRLIWDAVEEPK